ncbi:MAG: sigma-70 family RNA polymerase sigma factor [Gemmatimonadota bacterium]|nr:sigma-70 family RNA polymerase sigma factor [Gemmatimonadota bacterium]
MTEYTLPAPREMNLIQPRDTAFRGAYVRLVETHSQRLFRYLDRAGGDPELARDLTQEVFLRLYKRGALPDETGAWLITVAMNLLRNEKSKRARRNRLMTPERAKHAHSDPEPSPMSASGSESGLVRAALSTLPTREQDLLLLRAEGYAYRELAEAVGVAEASVGTLLARAKQRFLEAYQEARHAR